MNQLELTVTNIKDRAEWDDDHNTINVSSNGRIKEVITE